MHRMVFMAALLALLSAWPFGSRAAATFVPAANGTDMAYDARRNLLYVADGDQVLRYAVGSNRFLTPIVFDAGTQLRGMDLSRDGAKLAVADYTHDDTQGWVYVIDLATLKAVKHAYAFTDAFAGDGGAWSVAYAADGALLATANLVGTGEPPLRRMSPGGTWTLVTGVGNGTVLSPSTDRQTIAFAEPNTTEGAWGLYDVPTGQVVHRQGNGGTSTFNQDIATDPLGARFAIATYPGLYLYDDAYRKTWTLSSTDHHSVSVAFHPVRPIAYYTWSGTRQVRAFSSRLGQIVAWYDFGETFQWGVSNGYFPPRLKSSPDGSLLMALLPTGVRYLRLYAPLAAANVAATLNSGVATYITLKGSIGNHDPLAYGVQALPRHGKVSISGSVARYQSAAGYHGADSFRYIVRYGATAYAVATVNVTVH